MGIALPQVVTSDRASGTQVIDGSLKFEASKTQYLNRTFSAGNRKTWTWSGWIKKSSFGASKRGLFGYDSTNDHIRLQNNDDGGDSIRIVAPSVFDYILSRKDRDTGWFHLVVACDTTDGTAGDRVKIYHNGVRQTSFYSSSNPGASADTGFNQAAAHSIGRGGTGGDTSYVDASLSNVYWIDGLALGPGYFGFTDPLTGTWRPKKFRAEGTTVNDGTQWSSLVDVSNATVNNGSAANLFDGDITTKINITAGYIEIDLSSRNVQAGPEGIEVYNNEGGAYTSYQVNGGTAINWQASAGWMSMGGVNSKINTIRINHLSGGGVNAAFAFRVNGVTMVDSTTTNLAFGTNGFYLPMDGNSPIGEDKSGKGNNWTPVNFGGSVALDNPQVSGARPILNTDGGGNVARPGVFGSQLNQTIEVTVSNASGNNRYYFDGSLTPNLAFTRGSTITFHTTNNGNVSGDGHPFKLSSTNASGSGGTEYTDGVAYYINGSVVSGSDYVTNYSGGAASGFRGIKWTVPHNQSTTYYYCTIHTGMGNNGALTSTIDETKADPYAWKNVLAASLVDTTTSFAYDVSNAVNSGSTTKTIVSGGAAANAAQSNFYGASSYFSGTDDRLFTTSSSDFTYGTGDFTMEGWVYPTANNSNKNVFSTNWGADGSILITFSHPSAGGAGKFGFFDHTASQGSPQITTSNAYPINTWHHVAFVRNGTSHKFYINGIEDGSATYTATDLTRDTFIFGAVYTNGTETFSGYMSDVRVYKGVAKYTSNFVVPATSPDILPDTPSGVSGGSKLAKVTDGAVSFDGSGDSLSIPDNADFDFGTGDFTVELFTYNDLAQSSNPVLIGATGGWYLQFKTGGTIVEFYTGSTSIQATGLGLEGGWHHIAVTKASNVVKIFIDGILKSTTSNSDTTNLASTLYIGNLNGASLHYLGFISNVRIVKGTALYTTDFTPPTAPLTNVTNTKLLCCQSNTSADAAAVQPSTTSYFTGGTALTWASSPIGSKWTLSNSNKNATSSGGSGYTDADVFSVALAANTTYAWTLDVTNGDSTGGWYFADVQSNTGTHADEKGGNSLGLRGGETSAGYYGTFASANGGSDGESKISMNSDVSPNGAKSIDFVVYRPSSGTGKVWVKANDTATWIGGGNPSDTSSTATFIIPDGTTYFGFIDYDSGDTTNCNMRGDGDITSPPLIANGDAAATNFNPFNTDINTVRGQETGYATLNPLSLTKTLTLSDGNLGYTATSAENNECFSNIRLNGGKFYFESNLINAADVPGSTSFRFGICKNLDGVSGSNIIIYNATGNFETFGTTDSSPPTYTAGNTIGVSVDCVNGSIQFFKDGVSVGTKTFTVGTDEWTSYIRIYKGGGNTVNGTINFGQKPFKFPPPAGFQPLNAANVRPDTVFARPDQYFRTTLYTGNAGTKTINVGLKPDLVWIKDRTDVGFHSWFDTVRGPTKVIFSNEVNLEETQSGVTAFNSDGFDLGSWSINNAARTYVAWTWKAGGNKNTFNVDDVGYASASDVNMNVGGLNSSLYNTSQVWSSTYAGSAIDGSYPITQAFDGNRATTARVSAIQDVMSVALTNITVVDKIEVCGENGYITPNVSVTVGGVTHTIGGDPNTAVSGTSGTTTKTITGVSGALTNVTVGKISSGRTYLSQIIVDGKILVNSNITPPNVPSIAPTGCSVGTKQGFSIIKYTGEGVAKTINHGMNKVPRFMLVKRTDANASWAVYHASAGSTKVYELNTGGTGSTSSTVWNSTTPTSSVFSIGDYADSGGDESDFIAYLWADVPGLQKFGKWTNNNSNDGTFTELGFRPAILLLKDIDGGEQWYIIDSKRQTFNIPAPSNNGAAAVRTLQPSSPNSEDTADNSHPNTTVDFLSNGFKIRSTNTGAGEISFGTRNYIYAAWAEAPVSNLYGAQSNAR